MWHFLRNVEAVHDLVVLLQNRFLPIPHLDEEDRLAGVPIPGLPNFYRVSVRGEKGPSKLPTHSEIVCMCGGAGLWEGFDRDGSPRVIT